MDHSEIMGMITSPSSWEQVIYDVIAFEGLDPWDLDLKKLSEGFSKYVADLKEMNFKIPAKYLMVVSTLLRMKSDHLPLLNYFNEEVVNNEIADGIEESAEMIDVTDEHAINPLTIPPRRVPKRRVVVSELVTALRKVLGNAEKRETKKERALSKIKIKEDEIGKRITTLYDKINNVLTRIRGDEVKFSKLVPEWNKPSVANTFLPLVYLEHQKKVDCRQEEIFDEIFIKRPENGGMVEKIAKKSKEIKEATKINKVKKIKKTKKTGVGTKRKKVKNKR